MGNVCDECNSVHEFSNTDFGGCASCGGYVAAANTNGLCSDCVDSFRENVLTNWLKGE